MDEGLSRAQEKWRLGVVSYLNAKPLICGLDLDPRTELRFDVPSRLPTLLETGQVDAALVPVIDLLSPDRNWQVVSDACIGCDGETLTVRVFSRVPPGSVHRMQVDGDSHTSVALARIIWQERYGIRLDITPFTGVQDQDCDAILLIGDKVVTHTLVNYEIETDLGSAWKSLTRLPFVFAAWASPLGADVASLAPCLSRARDRGVEAAAMIAADFGPGMGWPVALARRYLTTRLHFFLGERQRAAMARFLGFARDHEIVPVGQELVFA